MTEVKCEKCGSKDGNIHHQSDGKIGGFSCKKCGHHTVFYHITEKGKEILEILLDPKPSSGDSET